MRTATIKRKTKETDIEVTVNLDGTGVSNIATGIGFFDHMLDLLARHSRIDLTVKAVGDLHIDHHHTTEDTGIALGQALKQALGNMAGITRYAGVHMPMDETLSRVVIDISGRPFLVFKADFPRDKIGEFDTELVREWFQAFAMNAGVTLHVETLYGDNSHHIAESCFKGLARALRTAVAIDPKAVGEIPSTKGSLGGSLLGRAGRAVCGITEFLGTGHRHVRLHSSCSLPCRSRSARDRQVRLRARRLPFLGDDLRPALAAVESAVAGADRLGDLRGRVQCRAVQPRRRPFVDLLRRRHRRAPDGIRGLQPAPLDTVEIG